MTIRIETVVDPVPILDELMPGLERAMEEIYGSIEGQISHGDPEYFIYPRGRLWVAYVDDQLAAMAGWTDLSLLGEFNPFEVPTVEIKRLFTRPQFQRLGLSKKLDGYLLHDIFSNGFELAVGETGNPQTASVHMHSVEPYRQVKPFGEYVNNDESFFFGVTREDWLLHLEKSL